MTGPLGITGSESVRMHFPNRCSQWPRFIVATLWLVFSWSAVASAAGGHPATHHHDPNALWHIVHDRCVPAARQGRMMPPCVQVSLKQGYVVMKDLRGVAQYLVLPTARVSGIESPLLLKPDGASHAAW